MEKRNFELMVKNITARATGVPLILSDEDTAYIERERLIDEKNYIQSQKDLQNAILERYKYKKSCIFIHPLILIIVGLFILIYGYCELDSLFISCIGVLISFSSLIFIEGPIQYKRTSFDKNRCNLLKQYELEILNKNI